MAGTQPRSAPATTESEEQPRDAETFQQGMEDSRLDELARQAVKKNLHREMAKLQWDRANLQTAIEHHGQNCQALAEERKTFQLRREHEEQRLWLKSEVLAAKERSITRREEKLESMRRDVENASNLQRQKQDEIRAQEQHLAEQVRGMAEEKNRHAQEVQNLNASAQELAASQNAFMTEKANNLRTVEERLRSITECELAARTREEHFRRRAAEVDEKEKRLEEVKRRDAEDLERKELALDRRGAVFNQRLFDLYERQRQANEDRSKLAVESERLSAEIQAFEDDKKNTTEKLNRRETALKAVQRECNSREAVLTQKEAANEEKNRGLEAREATVRRRELDIAQKLEEIESRVAELASREQHVKSREGKVEKAEVRLREERSEMDIIRGNMEFHKKSLLAAEEKIKEDEDRLHTATTDLERQKCQLEELEREREHHHRTLADSLERREGVLQGQEAKLHATEGSLQKREARWTEFQELVRQELQETIHVAVHRDERDLHDMASSQPAPHSMTLAEPPRGGSSGLDPIAANDAAPADDGTTATAVARSGLKTSDEKAATEDIRMEEMQPRGHTDRPTAATATATGSRERSKRTRLDAQDATDDEDGGSGTPKKMRSEASGGAQQGPWSGRLRQRTSAQKALGSKKSGGPGQ